MSSAQCWECGEEYSVDKVFDIPVFKKGFTIQWCLNCAMNQLDWTDYRLVNFLKGYKRPIIKSHQDQEEEYSNFLEELILCFESQFRKIKDVDEIWGELQNLAQEIQYEEKEEKPEVIAKATGFTDSRGDFHITGVDVK